MQPLLNNILGHAVTDLHLIENLSKLLQFPLAFRKPESNMTQTIISLGRMRNEHTFFLNFSFSY